MRSVLCSTHALSPVGKLGIHHGSPPLQCHQAQGGKPQSSMNAPAPAKLGTRHKVGCSHGLTMRRKGRHRQLSGRGNLQATWALHVHKEAVPQRHGGVAKCKLNTCVCLGVGSPFVSIIVLSKTRCFPRVLAVLMPGPLECGQAKYDVKAGMILDAIYLGTPMTSCQTERGLHLQHLSSHF